MTGAVCSLPGCGGDAVGSWQRVGTDAEAADYAAGLTGQMQAFVDAQRVQLSLEVEDIEARYARLQESGTASGPMLAVVDSQLEMKRSDLVAVVDAVPVPVVPVAMLVLACVVHAVGPESACQLHRSECLSVGPCACVLAPAVVAEGISG